MLAAVIEEELQGRKDHAVSAILLSFTHPAMQDKERAESREQSS